ncbi:class I SAM-dependent methyltransferase [Lacicoccus alkaliphilus]|uniref:Site-specific DNA-methyltransferase (Adenine-specific) n=1 Tax=Lacicoccus alkaliphilus DSM 16010 TaxID=1123231 RepID=A0A1M7AL54_9BACL|nr:class I SAM-dependent methyltransferase [Salinicoccus alkaliphilus]SHL43500.1 site-specific DNA-methyltransferase (adenine-specific) [Salinicoccus alkaliphilus DSM 16010]
MAKSNLEKVYQLIVDGTEKVLEENSGISRVEAMTEVLLSLQIEEGKYDYADMRKGVQFAYLYQLNKESVQPNHQLTPDSIGYLIAHLVQLFKEEDEINVLDAGSGTGHLSMTIREHAENVNLHGAEVDPVLARFNVALCEFLKVPMDIYPQNIIEPARLTEMDIAVGDLPIGYYPLDVEGFTTAFKEGRSFAHLLMLEAAMSCLKEDGIGIFVVPSNILEENNETIKEFVSTEATLLMFLNLPDTLFKTENMHKSIIVLKKGYKPIEDIEVLLGDVPDFKNAEQMKLFLDRTDAWYEKYAVKKK